MSNCINQKCRLCRNIVISTAVTVVTVDGVDTLVIDIPTGFYPDCRKVCLVVAQTIPAAATIAMPVAISIGGDTTTVYPIVNCDCSQVTACAIRTRTKYGLRISTTATSAVFKSLKQLTCYPTETLAVIPTPAVATPAVLTTRTATARTAKTATAKEVQA
jgi:hypothetical protein